MLHRDFDKRQPSIARPTDIAADRSNGLQRRRRSVMKGVASFTALIVITFALGAATQGLAPRTYAAPAPEVEYVYDVMVRRHYSFQNPSEAIDYGRGICDKVGQGKTFTQVMGEVKHDVLPNDEFAANYLVAYAVNLLCPADIWQLRNSAANYVPPSE